MFPTAVFVPFLAVVALLATAVFTVGVVFLTTDFVAVFLTVGVVFLTTGLVVVFLATGFATTLLATGLATALLATGLATALLATGFATTLLATGLATALRTGVAFALLTLPPFEWDFAWTSWLLSATAPTPNNKAANANTLNPFFIWLFSFIVN